MNRLPAVTIVPYPQGADTSKIFAKRGLQGEIQVLYCNGNRGCSSVVERHVANVNVVSSNLITRFDGCCRNIVSVSYRLSGSLALVADMLRAQVSFEPESY